MLLRRYLLSRHPLLFEHQSFAVARQHAVSLEELLVRRDVVPSAELRDVSFDVNDEDLTDRIDHMVERWVTVGESGARWLQGLHLQSLRLHLLQEHDAVFAGVRNADEARARVRQVAYAAGLIEDPDHPYAVYLSTGAGDVKAVERAVIALGSQECAVRPFTLRPVRSHILENFSGLFGSCSVGTRQANLSLLVGVLESEFAIPLWRSGHVRYMRERDVLTGVAIANAIGDLQNGSYFVKGNRLAENMLLGSDYVGKNFRSSFKGFSESTKGVRLNMLLGLLEQKGLVIKKKNVRYVRDTPQARKSIDDAVEVLRSEGFFTSKKERALSKNGPVLGSKYLVREYGSLFGGLPRTTRSVKTMRVLDRLVEDGLAFSESRHRYVVASPENRRKIDYVIAQLREKGFFSHGKRCPSVKDDSVVAMYYLREKYGALLNEYPAVSKPQKLQDLVGVLEEKGLVTGEAQKMMRLSPAVKSAVDSAVEQLRLQGFFTKKKMSVPLSDYVCQCLPYLRDDARERQRVVEEVVRKAGPMMLQKEREWYIKSPEVRKYVRELLL